MKELLPPTFSLKERAPLLLDGATGTNLKLAGMPASPHTCPEEWIFQHPQALRELHRGFLAAGSQVVYTPTATTNRVMLTPHGKQKMAHSYNVQLAQMTVENCKAYRPQTLVAGCVAPLRLQAEPFGDTPFLDLVNIYAHQAFALKEGGVDLLVAESMTSLSQCRAALLGCCQTKLPVLITLEIQEDGDTRLGCDLVSALIVCQSLGASAFGLSCGGGPNSHLPHLREIAPYASVPLIVKPDALDREGNLLSPQQLAEGLVPLWELGATLFGGCCHTTPAHLEAVHRRMEEFDFQAVRIPREQPGTLFMASETEPYFLDEFFSQSHPLPCQVDMSDLLLEQESEAWDVTTIQVDTVDDAYRFALNAHMLRRPVSFLSDSEEALEMALLMYNGRAFVDGRSSIPEEALATIARGYGAILR